MGHGLNGTWDMEHWAWDIGVGTLDMGRVTLDMAWEQTGSFDGWPGFGPNRWARRAIPPPGPDRQGWVSRMLTLLDARLAGLQEMSGK